MPAPTLDSFSDTPLSNFHLFDVRISGIYWKTNEHYFQAMKTLDTGERNLIWAAKTPGQAKRLGRKVTLRSDWEEIKLLVMRQAIDRKFTLESAPGKYLLKTGDRLLVEGNSWNDRFWGVCEGTGQNWLGVLLMYRRAALKAEKNEEKTT